MASMMMMISGGALLPMATQSFTLSPQQQLSFSRTQTLGVSLSTAPVSVSISSNSPPLVYCGRGDKKTAKGKRFNHSFGNARPRNKKKGRGPPRVPTAPSPPRKDKFDDNEIIKIDIDESLFTS